MRRLLLFLSMTLIAPVAVWAQDWQYDEASGAKFDCALVDELLSEHGEKIFLQFDDGSTETFAWFAATVFGACSLIDNAENDVEPASVELQSGAEADMGAPAANMSGSETAITAVLNDRELYSIADDECTVIVSDHYDADLNVLLIGEMQDSMSVDVYLPGESEPIAMPHVFDDEVSVVGLSAPTRVEWVERDSFPLGVYTFDVRYFDEFYRFKWTREDKAVNTVVLTCIIDFPEMRELDAAVVARLADGEFYEISEARCFITTSNLESDLFSFVVSGEGYDSIDLEVTFPGMPSPIEMEQVENLIGEEGIPFRIEWLSADAYPSGVYTISATIDEKDHVFEWDRQDDGYRTIFFSCLPPELED